MPVEWRTIPGYSRYQASDTGLIIRHLTSRRCGTYARIMRGAVLSTGYRLLNLVDDGGVKRQVLYHRAIAMAFHGMPPSEHHHAAHRDGDRANNQPSNLRWATVRENWRDKLHHGTQHYGSASHRAKLTPEQVFAIRQSTLSQLALSRLYNVSARSIWNVVHKRTYING